MKAHMEPNSPLKQWLRQARPTQTGGLGTNSVSKRSPVMEKRSTQRRQIKTSIVCSHFKSLNCGEAFDGKMKNCCSAGFYAELKVHVKAGTILVVRTTGSSWGDSADEGFRTLALAEVRWSNPKAVEGKGCYATGLRYLTAY